MKRMILAALAVILLAGCDLAFTDQISNPLYLPAERQSPPTPRERMAQLVFGHDLEAPAMEAFYLVAAERGWSEQSIVDWAPFVSALMRRESHYCPTVRGGDVVDENCNVIRSGVRSGHYSDSGFGQVNGVHWDDSRGGWLCGQEGICEGAQIVADPWTSMTALVALVERSGGSPWCHDAESRRSSVCRMNHP